MAVVVRMPSVLAGATEAALARWLVSAGDSVSVGTPLAEIETEKALVEYAAEEAGVVGRLVLGEGDTASIGEPIAVLLGAGESEADIDAALGGSAPASLPEPAPSALSSASAAAADVANGHQDSGQGGRGGRVFASPLVRKLAGERGVDLAGLAGSGPNGRIVRRDLERYLAAVPAGADSGAPAGGEAEHATVRDGALEAARTAGAGTTAAGDTLIPHTPMRRAIARRLAESKATVPHFYLTAECAVDELLALRARVNQTSPVKVSVNDFVIAAVAAAFCDVPEANVTWTDEGLLQHRHVDISIAVATDAGLVTPVLRGVEAMRLSAIARESADLARRARDRKLRQHEIEGGSFAVSNLGMYGTAEFSAIINPPQSGILAVGAARQQPVVTGGALAVATVLRCTLSVDHRAIDGALAARWLAAFSARVENPPAALI
jgi:pyruvate dehydrogenase E2 component (dihydrolipoamide acetyltransferase)